VNLVVSDSYDTVIIERKVMQKNSNEKNVMHFCNALNTLNENCLLKKHPVYDTAM